MHNGNGRKRKRLSPEERSAMQNEALDRAQTGFSVTNDALVVAGFTARGIPEDDVKRTRVLWIDKEIVLLVHRPT